MDRFLSSGLSLASVGFFLNWPHHMVRPCPGSPITKHRVPLHWVPTLAIEQLCIKKNPANIKYISSQLTEYFDLNLPSTSSVTSLWCAHKAFIRGVFMQLPAREKRQREQKLSQFCWPISERQIKTLRLTQIR